jgi:hypothetical protein
MNHLHKESLLREVSLTSGEHRIDDFVQRKVHTLEPVLGQRNNLVSTTTALYSRYRQLFQTLGLLLDSVQLSFTVQEYLH